ncbi:MAG: hypothetical protein ACI8UO_000642 [Verrucomicrobiales bacterium]|jgi:hypothetical protein
MNGLELRLLPQNRCAMASGFLRQASAKLAKATALGHTISKSSHVLT